MEGEFRENENNSAPSKSKRDYLLPASVFISAIMVSVSLVYSTGKKGGEANLVNNFDDSQPVEVTVKPVSQNDHFFGELNAPVKFIEYSDLECPFCKVLHLTMKDVMSKYNGKVVWIYRHFPLDALHPKARKEAEATECASELGGNSKFWEFIDRIFEVTPSNNGLDLATLPQIAGDVGLNKENFKKCLDSGKYADKVSGEIEDATNAGGRGTPYSLVIGRDGKKYPVSGALPQAQIEQILEQALK